MYPGEVVLHATLLSLSLIWRGNIMGGNENLGRDLDFFDLLERKNVFNPGREEGRDNREKLLGYLWCRWGSL